MHCRPPGYSWSPTIATSQRPIGVTRRRPTIGVRAELAAGRCVCLCVCVVTFSQLFLDDDCSVSDLYRLRCCLLHIADNRRRGRLEERQHRSRGEGRGRGGRGEGAEEGCAVCCVLRGAGVTEEERSRCDCVRVDRKTTQRQRQHNGEQLGRVPLTHCRSPCHPPPSSAIVLPPLPCCDRSPTAERATTSTAAQQRSGIEQSSIKQASPTQRSGRNTGKSRGSTRGRGGAHSRQHRAGCGCAVLQLAGLEFR